MIAHATGLALLVLGGQRDERTLSDYLARQGLGGPIATLCVDYLRGATHQGPVISMVDFVRRAADLLERDPSLAARVEAVLARYDLTVEKIGTYLRAIKGSSQGAFTSAMRGSSNAPAPAPAPAVGRLI